jgi:hypothetical protein
MNIIENQRETIIRENNTAQDEFIGIMENLSKSIKELVINELLHGDLDFSYLGERGFKSIETIELREGEITSIKNLPDSLKKLVCSHNLLTTLEIPRDLEILECENNYLYRLDTKSSQKIKVLHLSNNKLVELEHPSRDLEELYLNNNQLKSLELMECHRLRILHVSENTMLLLEKVPESVVELKSENSPFVNIDTTRESPAEKEKTNLAKIDFIESLKDYFKLKTKYETQVHEMRKKVFKNATNKAIGRKLLKQVKPKCVNCNRPVGSIFELKDERYIAMCGDPNRATKCNLHIELYRGGFTNEEYLVYLFREQVDSLKETIMKQKLDVLFSYKSDTTIAQQFKKELENYNTDSSMYKQLLANHNELYYNSERQEKIVEKMEKIETIKSNIQTMLVEYEKSGNTNILKDAMMVQINNLQPEIENLRRLKLDIMEMDNSFPSGGNEMILCSLTQKNVALNKTEFTFGEPSRVVKYSARK